ncbi:MAG: biotin transporter BioY [Ruminococcaceae bacterium]|nr:biotin transporter BioY [Oscillospiraceae bacterium]
MKTRDMILTALFAALTAVGAFIRIPLGISTITLQFLFTALAALLLGAKLGALSQAVYVALGLAGVPIFASGGGFQYVLNPTFGFLLGLIPAAYLIGRLSEGSLTPPRAALACFAGLGVLYLVGVPYMGVVCNAYLGKGLTLWQILKGGMLIYLPGDCLKIALCALTAPKLARSLSHARVSA